jgi:hypothetical protein
MEELIENYAIDEHIHRYACWTAARAASTSRFSNAEVYQFISDCGLKEAVQALQLKDEMNHSIYKTWFVEQANCLLKKMQKYRNSKDKERKKLFGVAAKLVSIYVKTVEVLPSDGISKISQVAFPPIDRYLLSGLKKELDLKDISWSKMAEERYMALIEKLKVFMGERPFWKLEFYWDLNKKQRVKN